MKTSRQHRGAHGRVCSLPRGFSLIEISLVLIIAGLALGAGLQALGPQLEQRRYSQTQEQLQAASDALFGFLVLNRRLPCPASAASNGLEVFCTNATGGCGAPLTVVQPHGRCANPFNGFLPGATLGLQGLGPVGDASQGRQLDVWNLPVRYAVSDTAYPAPVVGTPMNTFCDPDPPVAGRTCRPYTASDGLRTVKNRVVPPAVIPDPNAVNLVTSLRVCATEAGSTAFDCAAGQEVSRPAFVLMSTGRNGINTAGAEEAENIDNDAVFVSRPRVEVFDDVLVWQSQGQLVHRLNQAGLLAP